MGTRGNRVLGFPLDTWACAEAEPFSMAKSKKHWHHGDILISFNGRSHARNGDGNFTFYGLKFSASTGRDW